jgi:hypothetical protein
VPFMTPVTALEEAAIALPRRAEFAHDDMRQGQVFNPSLRPIRRRWSAGVRNSR